MKASHSGISGGLRLEDILTGALTPLGNIKHLGINSTRIGLVLDSSPVSFNDLNVLSKIFIFSYAQFSIL